MIKSCSNTGLSGFSTISGVTQNGLVPVTGPVFTYDFFKALSVVNISEAFCDVFDMRFLLFIHGKREGTAVSFRRRLLPSEAKKIS